MRSTVDTSGWTLPAHHFPRPPTLPPVLPSRRRLHPRIRVASRRPRLRRHPTPGAEHAAQQRGDKEVRIDGGPMQAVSRWADLDVRQFGGHRLFEPLGHARREGQFEAIVRCDDDTRPMPVEPGRNRPRMAVHFAPQTRVRCETFAIGDHVEASCPPTPPTFAPATARDKSRHPRTTRRGGRVRRPGRWGCRSGGGVRWRASSSGLRAR